MRRLIAALVFLTIVSPYLYAFPGHDAGGGGDVIALEFTDHARDIAYAISTEKSLEELLPEVQYQDYLETINSVTVVSKSRLFLLGKEIKEVDAINYPSRKLIEVSRSRWREYENAPPASLLALVFHEYLGIMGIDDSTYQVSSRLQGWILTNRPGGIDREQMPNFPQTTWDECNGPVTGQYTSSPCRSDRKISVDLKRHMEYFVGFCTNEALQVIGNDYATKVHIEHMGIMQASSKSDPRSLHSHSRAIDIQSLRLHLSNGLERIYKPSELNDRQFFISFRQCWGKSVHEFLSCPLYMDRFLFTGSIGHEDHIHRNFLHLSVPHCVNGKYGSYLFMR